MGCQLLRPGAVTSKVIVADDAAFTLKAVEQ